MGKHETTNPEFWRKNDNSKINFGIGFEINDQTTVDEILTELGRLGISRQQLDQIIRDYVGYLNLPPDLNLAEIQMEGLDDLRKLISKIYWDEKSLEGFDKYVESTLVLVTAKIIKEYLSNKRKKPLIKIIKFPNN